jgi:hypothetical protein
VVPNGMFLMSENVDSKLIILFLALASATVKFLVCSEV